MPSSITRSALEDTTRASSPESSSADRDLITLNSGLLRFWLRGIGLCRCGSKRRYSFFSRDLSPGKLASLDNALASLVSLQDNFGWRYACIQVIEAIHFTLVVIA